MRKAVIGLGFGDEGKGMFTDYLCSQLPDAMVVRFSGGHQAGHTVEYKNKRHVFANFGSGSLRGNPTYWSKHCTVEPLGLFNELDILNRRGVLPSIDEGYYPPSILMLSVLSLLRMTYKPINYR
jgi:adenylosuccinate synthase